MASKADNYKRSRSKYRATVISLFLSIVLFISASSFCAYLTRSAGSIYNGNGYELSCTIYSENNYDSDTLLTKIRAFEQSSLATVKQAADRKSVV